MGGNLTGALAVTQGTAASFRAIGQVRAAALRALQPLHDAVRLTLPALAGLPRNGGDTVPDNQGLDLHDVQVNHQTAIGANNRPVRAYVVTYSVGIHGPFTDSVEDTGDPEKDGRAIQAAMDNRVQLLRVVTQPQVAG